MKTIERLEALRNKRAALVAEKAAAEKSKAEAEAKLKEIGWDGSQPISSFIGALQKDVDNARAAAELALANAEKLAKEFE